MSENVERSSLDLRYEGHRLRDAAREARLLASIAERGIEEPLEGVDTPGRRYLLNGFKRCRCAKKLGIHGVPYVSLGDEEAAGIVSLMRVATDNTLGILEQARFVVDLLDDSRPGVGGRGRVAVAEQGLGLHAAESVERDEPRDSADSVPRRLPGLLVHVRVAHVQAHEFNFSGRDRGVYQSRCRPPAERAGHRAVGQRLLPGPRVPASMRSRAAS